MKQMALASLAFCIALLALSANAKGADRVLMLDKNMRAWQLVVPTADPWIRAGCEVDYRRFHPFLVETDVQNYDVLIVLGGRMPLLPSPRLTREDLDLLQQFLAAGKGVVLGFPLQASSDGAYDRQAMNQFLREIRANVQIGDLVIRDGTHRYSALLGQFVALRRHPRWQFATAERLTLGDSAPLKVLQDARLEIIAESYSESHIRKNNLRYAGPFPAIAIVQARGPVLLMPRAALGFGGPGLDRNPLPILQPGLADTTKAFLDAVVQRFLAVLHGAALQITPIAPNSVIPAQAMSRLAHIPVMASVPRAEPFPVETLRLNALQRAARTEDAAPEQWQNSPVGKYLRDGIRAAKVRLAPVYRNGERVSLGKTTAELQPLADFVKQAHLNLLWVVPNLQAMTDSLGYAVAERAEVQQSWQNSVPAMNASGAALFAGIDYSDFRQAPGQTVGLHGEAQAIWPPFDRRFWWQGFVQPFAFAARDLSPQVDAMAGLVLDTEFHGFAPASHYLMGHDFSNRAFGFFLAASAGYLGREQLREARTLQPSARFTFLLRNGLLPLYYRTLSGETERFGRLLRREIEKVAPGRVWGVFLRQFPGDWYSMGLLRGLSRPDRPIILFTYEPVVQPYLQWLRREEIFALHAVALPLWQYPPEAIETLLDFATKEHDGFWVPSLEVLQESGFRFPVISNQ